MRLKYLTVLALVGSVSCTPRYVIPLDGEYDYRVPVVSNEARNAFDPLLKATLKLTWTPRYRTEHYAYDFASPSGVRLDRPPRDPASPTGYRLSATDSIRVTDDSFSKIGAALVVARTARGEGGYVAAAVTAAHLVRAPDTLRTYLLDAMGRQTDILESMSVKVDEFLFVTASNGVHLEATLRRMDLKKDLALLTMTIPGYDDAVQEYAGRIGRSEDLRWGTYVYTFGFPHGNLRLTGGTVSLDRTPDRFNVDAAIRPGYSGGPVVAVRDGLPNLELVGLCQGLSVVTRRYLLPDPLLSPGTPLSTVLLDHIRVEEEEIQEYGLGYALSIDQVRQFLLESRSTLVEKGIDLQNSPVLKLWGF